MAFPDEISRDHSNNITEQLQAFSEIYKSEIYLRYSGSLKSYKILVDDLPVDIKNVLSDQRPGYFVKGSIGQGTNTYYPWIGIFNRKVSTGATNGFYVVLLFSDDLEDLYVTLNQGSTVQTREQTEAYRNFVYAHYSSVEGFQKGRIPTGGLTKTKSGSAAKNGRKYEDTNIFYRKYKIQSLSEDDFLTHLDRIVRVYFDCADKYHGRASNPIEENFSTPEESEPTEENFSPPFSQFDYRDFCAAVETAGLNISDQLILRFISALLTKPFVILTGLSGSGKTKLAQAFAMWICEDENQYCIVPVGADWTNREPLLGFPNALEFEKYVKPENRVLDLLIRAGAEENQHKPYFIILDEMNLSHVERYFADFLSAMESNSKIALHAGSTHWNEVPPEIPIPRNLFIIGTVNIDETTYMFSPKVLDRANVIEFSVTTNEMANYLQVRPLLNIDLLKAKGKDTVEDFIAIGKDMTLEITDPNELKEALISFFSELKKTNAEFGFRTASEILRFVTIASRIEPEWTISQILDAAIMQKLLPKVHGSRRKLEPVLKTLGTFCLNDGEKIEDYFSKSEITPVDTLNLKYPISFEKIFRMYQNLISHGFTSYAEA